MGGNENFSPFYFAISKIFRTFASQQTKRLKIMKISDLEEFSFYIGNTMVGSDVVASNEGIFVDDELVNTYDPNVVINDPLDLIEAIDDAISFCPSEYIRKRDREELGCYLGASLSIKDWWKENYE